jgi:hypothetical protein
MGGTVALGANTYSTCATVSVSTGVYLVIGQVLCGSNHATSVIFTAKLNSGTTSFSSGQKRSVAAVSTYSSIHLAGVFSSGAVTSVTIQVAPTIGGGSSFARAQTWQNAAGSTGTLLIAVKIL